MKKLIAALLIYFTASVYNNLYAAGSPPPPPGGGGGPPCWPPGTCIPIDGGVVFLGLAGLVYAYKKFQDLKKKC